MSGELQYSQPNLKFAKNLNFVEKYSLRYNSYRKVLTKFRSALIIRDFLKWHSDVFANSEQIRLKPSTALHVLPKTKFLNIFISLVVYGSFLNKSALSDSSSVAIFPLQNSLEFANIFLKLIRCVRTRWLLCEIRFARFRIRFWAKWKFAEIR